MSVHPTGSTRRHAITEAIRTEPNGWLEIKDLAERIGIDRSTVLHHARRLVAEGTAAVGVLREIGAPGRPPRIVIDAERLADVTGHVTLTRSVEVNPGHHENVEVDFEITVEEGPDEYAPHRTPRLGPVTAALRDAPGGDRLAEAIASTVAGAILSELQQGTIRLVIEPAPAPPSDTPDDQ